MRRVDGLICAGLVALALAAYTPLWHNDFIDLDDGLYISDNAHVVQGLTAANVAWAWTTFHAGFWLPLTWMSLQLDATLSPGRGPLGQPLPNPAVFHGQNLFWHAATAVLLFVALKRMTAARWLAALVAALFVVHPLHVESVAWATERKDVLSTFFLVLTVLLYAAYAAQPTKGRYLGVLLAFLLGLLSKPMLVTLPFALLLLDYWPLRRWGLTTPPPAIKEADKKTIAAPALPASVFGPGLRGLLLEKVPLLGLAVGLAVMTLLAQRGTDAVRPLSELPLSARLANALTSYGWYLDKTFWPTQLTIFYLHPRGDWSWGPVLIGAFIIAVVSGLALLGARRWPWLLVGWLWFVGTLIPVIGLLQSGDQARADRFVYVPHIGLFIALVWSAAALSAWLRIPRIVRALAAVAILAALAVGTGVQVGYWHDQQTVWDHALAVNPDNHRAYYNLANYFVARARQESDPALLARARREYEKALALQPDYRYYYGLGVLRLTQEDFAGAQKDLEESLQRNANSVDGWYLLGLVQLKAGRPAEAEKALRRTLQLQPDNAAALGALGAALWQQGQSSLAQEQWQKALRANPNEPQATAGIATLLLRQGKDREAARRLMAVAALPEHISLAGIALGRLGLWRESVQAQELALRMRQQQARLLARPDPTTMALYQRRLAYALHQAGRRPEAARQYAEALALDPDWPPAAIRRAWQLATDPDPAQRDPAEAVELASQVCQAARAPSAEALDALATALAASGRFPQAADTARQALAAAAPPLAEHIRQRLALYQEQKPYIDHRRQGP